MNETMVTLRSVVVGEIWIVAPVSDVLPIRSIDVLACRNLRSGDNAQWQDADISAGRLCDLLRSARPLKLLSPDWLFEAMRIRCAISKLRVAFPHFPAVDSRVIPLVEGDILRLSHLEDIYG